MTINTSVKTHITPNNAFLELTFWGASECAVAPFTAVTVASTVTIGPESVVVEAPTVS
jgi:hypothetical protein